MQNNVQASAQCAKRTFAKLQRLDSVWTDDARWLQNVANSAADGYMFAADEEDGNFVTRDFACDELEFVADGEVQVYDFAGSEYEEERFYERDIVVYKHKLDGGYWVMHYENIDAY
jgi:hypothetical protein